jgi:hypothetical protein
MVDSLIRVTEGIKMNGFDCTILAVADFYGDFDQEG